MSENSETKNVDEPTIKFEDDGVEHNINEMPDNAKELMARWHEKKKIRDEFIIKANHDIDDLNTLLGSYEARMKNILEPTEEKKIEVTK